MIFTYNIAPAHAQYTSTCAQGKLNLKKMNNRIHVKWTGEIRKKTRDNVPENNDNDRKQL